MKKHVENAAAHATVVEFEDGFAACFEPGEAAMRRARAEALRSLRSQIAHWPGTQTENAERLGIKQPRYSRLMRGEEHSFTLDNLVKIAARAGLEMHITTTEIPRARSTTRADASKPA